MQITGNLVLKERPGVHLQQMRDWILDSQSLSRILREKNSQGRGCCKMQSAFFSSFCLSSLGRRRKPLNAALWRRFKVAAWWFSFAISNRWMDMTRMKMMRTMLLPTRWGTLGRRLLLGRNWPTLPWCLLSVWTLNVLAVVLCLNQGRLHVQEGRERGREVLFQTERQIWINMSCHWRRCSHSNIARIANAVTITLYSRVTM